MLGRSFIVTAVLDVDEWDMDKKTNTSKHVFQSQPLYTTPPSNNLSLSQDTLAISNRVWLYVETSLLAGRVEPVFTAMMPTSGSEPQLTVTGMKLDQVDDDITSTSSGSSELRSTESWTRDDLARWRSNGPFEVGIRHRQASAQSFQYIFVLKSNFDSVRNLN